MSEPVSPPAPPSAERPAELTVLAFIAIIGATSLVAALGGLVAGGSADPWYIALNKAPGTPSGPVFGIVWPILYVLMAIGACMVWQAAGSWRSSERALKLYFLQLVPNLGWSVLFFGLHQALAALIDLALLYIVATMMVAEFGRLSRVAALLQYPYLAWLAFAGYLNVWVVFAN